jgi:hypothetical protein
MARAFEEPVEAAAQDHVDVGGPARSASSSPVSPAAMRVPVHPAGQRAAYGTKAAQPGPATSRAGRSPEQASAPGLLGPCTDPGILATTP